MEKALERLRSSERSAWIGLGLGLAIPLIFDWLFFEQHVSWALRWSWNVVAAFIAAGIALINIDETKKRLGRGLFYGALSSVVVVLIAVAFAGQF